MIASVRGEVIDIALDHTVIEAAGVGYKVMATPATLATLKRGAETRLITAMIVREDSQTLYGFADTEARDLFLTLLGVSGVGQIAAGAHHTCAITSAGMYCWGSNVNGQLGTGDPSSASRPQPVYGL